MANSNIMYSDAFQTYRLALARWTAKNNYMMDKLRRILKNVALTEIERNTIEGLLEDLATPCDIFITDMEMNGKCV